MLRDDIKKVVERVTEGVEYGWSVLFRIIRPPITQIFQIMDEGSLSKRLAVWSGIGLTIYCINWVFELVMNPPQVYSGTDVAAIIGAILIPMAGLTGALMKYGESIGTDKGKKKNDESEG